MAEFGENRPRQKLLLLSAADTWASSVRDEIAIAGLVDVHCAQSAVDAVRRLAAANNPFSHLLVEPSYAGDLMQVLTELTAGEPGSTTALILLGGNAVRPPMANPLRTRTVTTKRPGWLARVLDQEFGSEDAEPSAMRTTTADLRDALAQGRLTAHYQPVVRMSDRMPLGLEVLARLESPFDGILPPDIFVPQIEAAGLGWELTEAVARRAFEDWGDGRLAALGLSIALNFPLDVLLMPSALSWLDAQRELAGIPAASIVIELTESQPIGEVAGLRLAIRKLRDLGYQLAIDDVGPNIRDYRALLSLDFTILKLDKNLVQDSPDSGSAGDFLAATIAAARRAGLEIVGEGIQNKAIWDRMAALGVDQAQGFMVARPLPAKAVELWLTDWCANHMN